MLAHLPDGPRFAPLQTFLFFRDTDRYFREGVQRYGDPFTVPLAFATAVVTGSADGIKEICTADPDTFEPFGTDPLGPIIGEHSLILLSGAAHKRERKLLMPPFHGERMRAYGALMQRVTEERVARLRPGAPFDAQALTEAISLDIIIQAIFGVVDPARVERFRAAVHESLAATSPLFLMFGFLRRPLFGIGPWDRFQRASAAVDRLMQEEIEARRRDGADREDILSLLLSARDEAGQPLTDSELKDELRTMILAGHETTAISMAWALSWLHRTPAVKSALADELAALGPAPEPEKLAKLPYLDAVCSEALRIHPVLPFIARRAVRPFSLRGVDIAPGTGVIGSIFLAHANPAVFPSPDQFRPERFLERKFSPFEYFPFGGGSRRCLGAAFALYEMKIALGTLMARHRLVLASDRPIRPVRRNVTFGPEGGVPMVYRGAAAEA